MTQKHCNCKSRHKLNNKFKAGSAFFPSLMSLLVVLLPKCPFCIAGYSAAITVCGSKNLADSNIHWLPWLSIGLMLLILVLIFINYKGRRSILATLFVLAGIMLVGYSELLNGSLLFYNIGSAFMLIGVWVNGSFAFVYKRVLLLLTKTKSPVVHSKQV